MGYDDGDMTQDLVTILRDPMVRTILAVVAISTTVLLFLIGRRRKGLSYMLSDTRVLGVHEAVNPSRVQILFDGKPVTDVHLVTIRVNNSGNEPIRADDFERALRFNWAEPTRILMAEVIELSPESLQPTINSSGNEIIVDPLLMNPGDSFRVKTLINQVSKLSVDARIVGVKRIRKTIESGKETFGFVRKLFVAAALGVVCLIIMLVGQRSGLVVANGRAEVRLTVVFFLVILYLLVDQVKTSVLELRNFYREKKDGST
ncbi:MAG: hypothetical protein WBQ56_20855 [Candidatus Sulfotelmatobacter sp.]